MCVTGLLVLAGVGVVGSWPCAGCLYFTPLPEVRWVHPRIDHPCLSVFFALQLLDNMRIHMLLIANPDGVSIPMGDGNCENNNGRLNDNGVDLDTDFLGQ